MHHFRVPKNSWPYKRPPAPKARTFCVSGGTVSHQDDPRAAKETGTQTGSPLQSDAARNGWRAARSWECIQTRPTALISLLQKYVLGVTHDGDRRYQTVVWYWSTKQIYSAEPKHSTKQTLTLNFLGKYV